MRTRSSVLAGAVALASVVLLSGCIGPSDDGQPVSTPTSFATTTPTAAPTATPTPRPTATTPAPTPEPTSTVPGDGRASVTPLITYSGYEPSTSVIEVASFVPDVVEGDGTCTLTLSNGSDNLVQVQAAQPDAAAMQCGSIFIQLPAGASGNWVAAVQYSSSAKVGTSSSVTIKVG